MFAIDEIARRATGTRCPARAAARLTQLVQATAAPAAAVAV
jgi:hypothetical protein